MTDELEDRCRELESELSYRDSELFDARRQINELRTQLVATQLPGTDAFVNFNKNQRILELERQLSQAQEVETHGMNIIELERKVADLEKEVEVLRQNSEWQPVPDGEVADGLRLENDGECLVSSWPSINPHPEGSRTGVPTSTNSVQRHLPPQVRLCRRVAKPAAQTGEWWPVAEGYSFVDNEVNRRIVVSKKDVSLYFHYEATEEMNNTLADWFNIPDDLAVCRRVAKPAQPDYAAVRAAMSALSSAAVERMTSEPRADLHPQPPLAEIRMLVFALEAWQQYNTGGDAPSHTELRDMAIVKRWLDMMQPQRGKEE